MVKSLLKRLTTRPQSFKQLIDTLNTAITNETGTDTESDSTQHFFIFPSDIDTSMDEILRPGSQQKKKSACSLAMQKAIDARDLVKLQEAIEEARSLGVGTRQVLT